MGQEFILVRRCAISWHIHHQRNRSTVIEEVLRDTHASSSIAGSETTIEVACEIDFGAVVHAWGQDTRDHDADIWFGVVADDSSINDEG